MPRFGAHMSIAGGLNNAIALAVRFRCRTLQMFVKNQRQWRAKPLTRRAVESWLSARAQTPIAPVVAHDSYLINLACPRRAGRERSYRALADELDRCHRLGVEYLVAHPGSHLGSGQRAGIERIVGALRRLADERPDASTRLLLETTAGQGTSVGHRFEQIAEILDRLAEPERFGVCLDTCHVFAAGYDLRTPKAVARTLDEFDRVIGLSRLHVIHVNDSKRALGSRVDRHEHIGRGAIGARGLAAVIREPRLAELPMILETPKGTDPDSGRDWDAVNLARLRRLARSRQLDRAPSRPAKPQA